MMTKQSKMYAAGGKTGNKYKKGGKIKAKKYADGGAVGVEMPDSVQGLGPNRNATLSRNINKVALANQEPGGASRGLVSRPSVSIEEKAPKSSIKPKKDPGKMKGGGKVKGYKRGGMARGCGAATRGRGHSAKMG